MYSGEHAEPKEHGCLRSILKFIAFLLILFVLQWAVRSYVVQPFQIPSGSMEETIMTGDMIFSEKISYATGEIQQGDIVTFDDPQVPSRTLIKRVIATEGQTVNLIDGQVYVDGVALDEPYTQGKPSYPLEQAKGQEFSYPYTVPEGELWVMGDNRTNSQDSRFFGSIKESSVSGKAVFTYWPLNHIGILE